MSGILNLLLGSAASVVKDAYFNLVTLLLNTTSTNGAQNNTFLDSSSNNFSITRNGNTTQGTFTPFSQTGWSNYGDGVTVDGLTSATSSAYTFGTGDWCVELWFYRSGNGASSTFLEAFIDMRDADVTGNGVAIGTKSDGSIRAYDSGLTTAAGTFSSNTWTHLVYTRQSGAIRIFLNGIMQAYNGSYTTNYTNTNCRVLRNLVSTYGFNGYVSNVRIIKGSVPSLYQTSATSTGTTVFTPPTTPLTAVSGTSLLTSQSNRFVDNSTNAFTLTPSGTPSVQAFSPFAPTTAYDTAVVGGSGYFDGSGDYLQIANNTALNLAGTSWTIECWYYPTALGGSYRSVLCKRQNLSGEWDFGVSNSDYVYFWNGTGYSSSTKPQLNAWNHMAATHDGTNLRLYLNGSLVYGPTAMSITNTTDSVGIGAVPGGGQTIQGYMCSARITKGGALYTGSTYTVPTAPFTTTVSSGTANLLINYTNAGIYDAAAKNDLETVGNAQVSTTQAKWGSTSMYFDGTGDWLQTQTTTNGNYNFTFGSADFTIEMWVYPTNSNSVCLIQGQTDNSTISGGSFLLRYTGTTDFYSGGTTYSCTSATPTANQWSHIAYVRNGTSLKTYLNGTQVGTATLPSSTTAMNVGSTNNATRIGAYVDGTGGFTGYIDDLRITKGYARYTANFTPPSTSFPIQ